jgi:Uma2 family endonuclease
MSAAVLETKQDTGPAVRRWTAADYERAAEAGVFGPEERLELVYGEIYQMSPQNATHSTVVGLVGDALTAAIPGDHCVRIQMPLSLGASSVPEPDVCVVTGSRRDYLRRHPNDAALVVEVADTSVAFDLNVKTALYASATVQEYWVVMIPERALVVHREPDPQSGSYRSVTRLHGGDHVSPLVAPEAKIPVTELLP